MVIDEIRTSGLRGRGGAGFPTFKKWEFARQAPGEEKYVICNGDEGDPGAYMDRAVLEGDPHRVLEGLILAGYGIGAQKGFFYVRAEYPLAVQRINQAIQQARAYGLLGKNILGTGFNFDVEVRKGAGAFVCGEETALIASLEGERGMPRPRPPFPAVKGFRGKSSTINNVETLANVPQIVAEGGARLGSIGTARSKGTKVFAVTGKVRNTGLVEVPMGTTIREVIFDICGGMYEGREFKAVQIGGPSGGCLPAEMLDLPIEYEGLTQAGAMMGSGGLVVLDDTTCMVDLARFFLTFTTSESCGKCTPCREGTKRMLEILERISRGYWQEDHKQTLQRFQSVIELERLARVIKDTALCGLGQTAPNPVLSTLRYFREEYEAHVFERRCPAGVCQGLLHYRIDPARCTGCGLCQKACNDNAVIGEKKMTHYIIEDRCIRCGSCAIACRMGAVVAS
jgi:NADH-quinone oxidoreductase subunit F